MIKLGLGFRVRVWVGIGVEVRVKVRVRVRVRVRVGFGFRVRVRGKGPEKWQWYHVLVAGETIKNASNRSRVKIRHCRMKNRLSIINQHHKKEEPEEIDKRKVNKDPKHSTRPLKSNPIPILNQRGEMPKGFSEILRATLVWTIHWVPDSIIIIP